MSKLKPTIFAVVMAIATLAPAASASAGVQLVNHNETLLLDA
jgi:hypothetical protein